jgi:hypothetical protein
MIGATLVGGGVSYRISRGFKLSLGADIDMHNIKNIHDMTYSEVSNMPQLTAEVLDEMLFINRKSGEVSSDTASQILNQQVNYTVTRTSIAGSLVLSPVLNLSRSLNLSIGAGPPFGVLDYTQRWDQIPIRSGDYVYMNRKDIGRQVGVVGAAAEAGAEWFILPRFAFTIGARFIWLYPLPASYQGWDSLTDNEEYCTTDDRSTLSFGLNPFMLPDGTPWSDTLFQSWWAYAFIGITFYL